MVVSDMSNWDHVKASESFNKEWDWAIFRGLIFTSVCYSVQLDWSGGFYNLKDIAWRSPVMLSSRVLSPGRLESNPRGQTLISAWGNTLCLFTRHVEAIHLHHVAAGRSDVALAHQNKQRLLAWHSLVFSPRLNRSSLTEIPRKIGLTGSLHFSGFRSSVPPVKVAEDVRPVLWSRHTIWFMRFISHHKEKGQDQDFHQFHLFLQK